MYRSRWVKTSLAVLPRAENYWPDGMANISKNPSNGGGQRKSRWRGNRHDTTQPPYCDRLAPKRSTIVRPPYSMDVRRIAVVKHTVLDEQRDALHRTA
jgi:hypothetical protein